MTTLMASIAYCIVGCNTGAPDKEALHLLRCDTETGKAEIVETLKGFEGTTYFQLDRARRNLYSVIGEKRDAKSTSAVVKFKIENNHIGVLTRLCDLPCEAPCHVALSPDEKLVSFAAYLSGTYGFVDLADEPVGRATSMKSPHCAVLPNVGMGPREDRQQKAYAHCTFYTPDGKTMGVIDLGCDRIHFVEAQTLEKQFELVSDPGDGPRHALFSHDNKFLFVVNELSSSITSYAYDATSIVDAASCRVRATPPPFRRLGKWTMVPPGTDPKSTKAAAIKLTEDGKTLMASNRGLDSIAFFDVNADGTLKPRGRAMLRGKFPRDFELMPGEKFMVVGHKMSNEIQVYAFNRTECTITPVGDPIPCWRPLCFKFL